MYFITGFLNDSAPVNGANRGAFSAARIGLIAITVGVPTFPRRQKTLSSLSSLFTLVTALSGSYPSSYAISLIFLPLMPPDSLTICIYAPVPALKFVPRNEAGPVRTVDIPTVISLAVTPVSACTGYEEKQARTTRKNAVRILFIAILLSSENMPLGVRLDGTILYIISEKYHSSRSHLDPY